MKYKSLLIGLLSSLVTVLFASTYSAQAANKSPRGYWVDSSGTIFDCFLNNPAVRRMLVSSDGGSNADNVRSAVEWALKNDRKMNDKDRKSLTVQLLWQRNQYWNGATE